MPGSRMGMSLSCVVVCSPSGSRPGLISKDATIHLGASLTPADSTSLTAIACILSLAPHRDEVGSRGYGPAPPSRLRPPGPPCAWHGEGEPRLPAGAVIRAREDRSGVRPPGLF